MPLSLYPELKHGDKQPTKEGAALDLLKETTHDNEGPKTELNISGLEQPHKAKGYDSQMDLLGVISGPEHHAKARKDESPIDFGSLEHHPRAGKDERGIHLGNNILDFELHSGAKNHGGKTTIDDAISGLEAHSAAKHELLLGEAGLRSSFSSSSSSSSGSLEKLDIAKGELLGDSFSKPQTLPFPINESLLSSDNMPQTPQWSMVSASPRGESGRLFSTEFNSLSAMKSPPVQAMTRPAGYDPNRIPSHIFSNRPATPVDWSVASNESLFSIHMGGNSSFSRDHIFMLGDTKPEEWSNIPPPLSSVSDVKSNESNLFSANLPPVFEAAPEHEKNVTHNEEDHGPEDKSHKVSKESTIETLQENHKEKLGPVAKEVPTNETLQENDEEKISPDAKEVATKETLQEKQKVKVGPGAKQVALSTLPSNLSESKGSSEGNRSSVSAPRVSNESAASSASFAFPVMVEVTKSTSLKAIDEEKRQEVQSQQLSQPQSLPLPQDQTAMASKPAAGNWFSSFMCWPRCC